MRAGRGLQAPCARQAEQHVLCPAIFYTPVDMHRVQKLYTQRTYACMPRAGLMHRAMRKMTDFLT